MSPASKIISATRQRLDLAPAEAGSVLCYGHFNVIHPGHIRFLQHARSLGTSLTVAVIGDKSIPAEQRKRYFSETERAEGLASLQLVNRVIILSEIDLLALVSQSKPDFLVLGKEFEQTKRPDLRAAIEFANSYGGEVVFQAGEIHYASFDLLDSSLRDIECERRQFFLQVCRRQELDTNVLINRVRNFQNCRMLVIGDSIVDQYVACDAIGVSAEAPVLVVKELQTREFVGGAGIVAAHIRALGAECTFLSVVGDDENARFIEKDLGKQGIQVKLLKDDSRPTTFKIRYMVENQKLFRVSRMKEHSLSQDIEDDFIQNLKAIAPSIDGIVVCDFVYGVITNRILEEVLQVARDYGLLIFGDLQCSSQVGNVGKFQDFNLICPTEREARIALSNQQDGIEWIANRLMEQTRAKNLVVKLGAEGFIAYSVDATDGFVSREHFPALVSNPADVAGAGDSLLAALAVSMCSGGSLMESSAIGTCMAALAVQTLGNVPIHHQKLENYIAELEHV